MFMVLTVQNDMPLVLTVYTGMCLVLILPPNLALKVPSALHNTKINYCLHNSPPTVPTLNEINPVHAIGHLV